MKKHCNGYKSVNLLGKINKERNPVVNTQIVNTSKAGFLTRLNGFK